MHVRSALCLLGLLLAGLPATGVTAGPGTTITYRILFNGQVVSDEGTIAMSCGGDAACVRRVPAAPRVARAPEETGWVDYAGRRIIQTAEFSDRTRGSYILPFAELSPFRVTSDRDTILGFACVKATATVRSNQIDLWFTRDAGVRGTPALNVEPPDGLVLKTVRNGTYEVVAESYEPGTPPSAPALPTAWGDITDVSGYRERVTQSWITTVPIFTREQIRYDAAAPRSLEPDERGVLRFGGGTLVVKHVRLPASANASIWAEVVERSLGDAYDRTGSVIVIPTDRPRSFLDALRDGVAALPLLTGRDGRTYQGIAATADYLPPVEVMRFITPYGVGKFNDQLTIRGVEWADSVTYKMDVTELAPMLHGDVWIGVYVGNYDAFGHQVSLTLRYHANQQEEAPLAAETGWIQPLCCTTNVLEMDGQQYGRIFESDTLHVDFTVPAGGEAFSLRYLTTGHGGWGGGDEFNPKMNTILLDGRMIGNPVPWRSDCATFRRFSPAAGAVWNGLYNSDHSRSGWCPGTTVNPYVIPLPGLSPGAHRLSIAIPAGAPEGNSSGAWNVSAAILGTRTTRE